MLPPSLQGKKYRVAFYFLHVYTTLTLDAKMLRGTNRSRKTVTTAQVIGSSFALSSPLPYL